VTELVASKIMELAKTGEPDTTRLSELVLKEFDSPSQSEFGNKSQSLRVQFG
jgi:hypothetical protein